MPEEPRHIARDFAEMVVEMLDEHEVTIGCEHTLGEVAHAIAVEAEDYFSAK